MSITATETHTPRRMLKALRNRAGVSSTVLAEALGFGAGTGYLRYENDTRFDTRKIPYRIISVISPLLVGKGEPPVTHEELLAISEVGALSSILHSTPPAAAHRAASSDRPEQRPEARTSGTPRLPVRYRIEGGVLITQRKLETLDYGLAPIIYSREWDQHTQFAALVGDACSQALVSKDSYLHCVAPDALTGDDQPSLVVLAVPSGQHIEIVVAKVSGDGYVRADGTAVSGRVLGAAVAEYRRL
jgi:hypothetical protein